MRADPARTVLEREDISGAEAFSLSAPNLAALASVPYDTMATGALFRSLTDSGEAMNKTIKDLTKGHTNGRNSSAAILRAYARKARGAANHTAVEEARAARGHNCPGPWGIPVPRRYPATHQYRSGRSLNR